MVVVFREDGTVGKTVIIQGLPAGLNEQGINSAKSIEFKPERRNGAPVSVAKEVMFEFSIF